MARRRWSVVRLTSRAVRLVLLVLWGALVVWKAMTFLSEPTGSETYFESDYHKPYLTVCSYHGVGPRARKVIVSGTYQEQLEYFGNGTLRDVIWREGFSLLDMMPYLSDKNQTKEDPNERRLNYTSRGGFWTTSVNYALGGLCGTLDVRGVDPYLKLARRYDFQEMDKDDDKPDDSDIAYKLYVHRLKDFWGSLDQHMTLQSDAEMAQFDIMGGTDLQELVIDVEREIMPNLRRRPCVEDPTYSRSTCWRQCFFNTLNCSVLGGSGDNRPLCRAVDLVWYHNEYFYFVNEYDAEDDFVRFKYPCSCPRPCLLDRYNLLVRPSPAKVSSRNHIRLKLFFKPVMRTVETRVTYGEIDLMADVGGFLGLLLGYSVLSVFDDFQSLTVGILNKLGLTVAPKDIEQGDRENYRRNTAKPYSIRRDVISAWAEGTSSLKLSGRS